MSKSQDKAAVNWTEQQWDAITARGGNLLVSAAAGSGKTAVLVERIILRLLDPDEPVDVDRLLVVTFTHAAAAEMKERIRSALQKASLENPDSSQLRRQLTLVHRATITTLHSFCMEVVREHFHQLALDPGFRIIDDAEALLMRHEAAEQALEEALSDAATSKNAEQLLELFGRDRSDQSLLELMKRIYEVSRSHPWPDHWLDLTAARYDMLQTTTDESHEWIHEVLSGYRRQVKLAAQSLQRAHDIAQQPAGPEPYQLLLHAELSAVKLAESAESMAALRSALAAVIFERLPGVRGEAFDTDLKEDAQNWRNDAKKRIKELQDGPFMTDWQSWCEESAQMAVILKDLIQLVRRYAACYQTMKSAQRRVDFADLEHLALQVFVDHDAPWEQLIPSAAARSYQDRYVEIMTDEYQDTNALQEALLRCVARTNPGNRFMVGDVKQSIYRFRLTDPKLFMDKYQAYNNTFPNKRIDLSNNFRSRTALLCAINAVFEVIMQPETAEMAYDENAKLKPPAVDPDPEITEPAAEWVWLDRDQQDEDEQPAGEQLAAVQDAWQAEAEYIADRIVKMTGTDGTAPQQFWDRKQGKLCDCRYADIVVLLRAVKTGAPRMMEVFRTRGIPVHSETSTGYFDATEVRVVLALLQVLDNPFQDIPMAAVMRSPIFGFDTEQLAEVKAAHGRLAFSEAVDLVARGEGGSVKLQQQLNQMQCKLAVWREYMRTMPLHQAITMIFEKTGYERFVSGLPDGVQRQANLQLLIEKAKQLSQGAFRGLYRFLRFVEQWQEWGGDMGIAKSSTEQDNVVRILSVHRSKGLEFPVVFMTGLQRKFNEMDLRGQVLLHPDLGIGLPCFQAEQRYTYPSLSTVAIRRKMKTEMMAEEMRILYVAMTRARDKLILVASGSYETRFAKWEAMAAASGDLVSGIHPVQLAEQTNFADWIGPVLFALQPESWSQRLHKTSPSLTIIDDVQQPSANGHSPYPWDAVRHAAPLPNGSYDSKMRDKLRARWAWQSPVAAAALTPSKTSVSKLKELWPSWQDEAVVSNSQEEAEDQLDRKLRPGFMQEAAQQRSNTGVAWERPKFMQQQELTPTERGNAFHLLMQHISLSTTPGLAQLGDCIDNMLHKQLLTAPQAELLQEERAAIGAFFDTSIGKLLLRSPSVKREVAFHYAVPPEVLGIPLQDELILVQGVIDVLFEDPDHQGKWVLLDYKSDRIGKRTLAPLVERYRTQIAIYAEAVQHMLEVELQATCLYFFDGAQLIELPLVPAERGQMR